MNLALLIMSLALLALYLSQCVYLIVSFFVYSFILTCFYYYYYYYYFAQNRLYKKIIYDKVSLSFC